MPIALNPVLRRGANFTCRYQGVSHAEWRQNNDKHPPRQISEAVCYRAKQWTSNVVRPDLRGPQNAQRSYERYLALAQAQAQSGDVIGAENYYQHAEHHFRSMSSGRETT